jgi:hypothetical protein
MGRDSPFSAMSLSKPGNNYAYAFEYEFVRPFLLEERIYHPIDFL